MAQGEVVALAAQSTSASIIVTIRDPQSAAIRGAVVSASSPERGWQAKATTDQTGSYTFYPVPPGLYRLSIEAPGFQQKSVADFQVDLDSRVRVDAEMDLATVGATVSVEAVRPQVQRDSAARESVIEARQILDLPLDGVTFSTSSICRRARTRTSPMQASAISRPTGTGRMGIIF